MNKEAIAEMQAALRGLPVDSEDKRMVAQAIVDIVPVFAIDSEDIRPLWDECMTSLGLATFGARSLVAKKKTTRVLTDIVWEPGTMPRLVVLASMIPDANKVRKSVSGLIRLPVSLETVKTEAIRRCPPPVEA